MEGRGAADIRGCAQTIGHSDTKDVPRELNWNKLPPRPNSVVSAAYGESLQEPISVVKVGMQPKPG